MCLEISPGTCPTVFSRGSMSTIALRVQQYGYFFRLFACLNFHCNNISVFSITPYQVFVSVMSTSCDFCLKTSRHFFFLYLMLHKLLLQKFQMECFVQLNSIVVCATMYLLRMLFYDGGEHAQQFQYVRFLLVFINQGIKDTLLHLRYITDTKGLIV